MQEVDPASASGAAVGVEDVSMVRNHAEDKTSNLRGTGLRTSVGLTCGRIGEACYYGNCCQ